MTRLLTVFVVCGVVFGPAMAGAQDALVLKGVEVYAARKCSMCHSVAGKGNPKGSLDDAGNKYTADELREWILDPAKMSARTGATRKPPMREFPGLAKADVDGLVAYLQTLRK